MFTAVTSPTNHFTLLPFPGIFFEDPPPFGAGVLLLLNRFNNNSATLLPEHLQGIAIAAAQARSSINSALVCEVYGFTDRSGSENVNKVMSDQRASAANNAMTAAAGINGLSFSNGLGERFADEYFHVTENGRDDAFRGVAVYLWDSFSTATDPFLKVNVAFASPESGIEGRNRTFLAALHMGRLKAQPASPFR